MREKRAQTAALRVNRKNCAGKKTAILAFIFSAFLAAVVSPAAAQSGGTAPRHPHVFFDSTGMAALRNRALTNPRLNEIWRRFKTERVDSAFNLNVTATGVAYVDSGRAYGDALGELSVAYIIEQDSAHSRKAIQMMRDLSALPNWGNFLSTAHISLGSAFAWDVLYSQIPDSDKAIIRQGILDHADNSVANDVYSNINWTASAGEGLVGLAFRDDGDPAFNRFVAGLLSAARTNFKEKSRSVLWAHGSDGFPHEGLGYWRKYIHIGLFFQAVRHNDPADDWFHLGSEFPGSEFLKKTGYPRIYADAQHPDLAALTWADSRQVRSEPGRGPFGSIGLLTLIASEYDDGYVMDFIDYLLQDTRARFDPEDWATFLFYDDVGVPRRSFRDLPLSRYWPDMEAAIFRSSWDKDALIFYMRSGSPGGHARYLKQLSPGSHDHPDANGFVIFYDNDYLAAEDGAFPQSGPDKGSAKITYGHNTILVDGKGQKGDRTKKILSTQANMDYLDAEGVGYLLGDASDAYDNLSRFFRYVIYRKGKYVVMLDELADAQPHKYEYLLGADSRHTIAANGPGQFLVSPQTGAAEMPVVFVEPRAPSYTINRDRPYAIDASMVDLLRVSPTVDSSRAAFLTLLYPRKSAAPPAQFETFYFDSLGVSGLKVDGDEFYFYNKGDSLYEIAGLRTDAKLCFYKDGPTGFEYLTSGSREFFYNNRYGVRSTQPIVAAFKQTSGKIRIGKNLGANLEVEVTLFYPGLKNVLVDSQFALPSQSGPGWMTFSLHPKQRKIGPSGSQQTVTENYTLEIIADPPVKVLSPNGGELWAAGSPQTIRWHAEAAFQTVAIDFSPDLGATWQAVTDSAANDSAFAWPAPDIITDNALIRIRPAGAEKPFDVSDGVFSIDKPPVLNSFAPQRAPAGAVISLFGENLRRVNAVSFAGALATEFTIAADTLLRVTAPDSARSGKIAISNRIGSAISGANFTVGAAPFVDSFSPLAGPVGAQVFVRGRDFLDASRVTFDQTVTDEFTVLSDTLLRATVPPAASTGPVGVVNPVGAGFSGSSFRVQRPPVLLGFSPGKGPVGARVNIFGRNFLDVTRVRFSAVAADSFTVLSDSLLFALTPAGASSGQIIVESSLGESASEGRFTVTFAPVLSDFSPRSGPVGAQVRIRGRHLFSVSRVAFNETPAQFFQLDSDSALLATVPPGATNGEIGVTGAGKTVLSGLAFIVIQPVRKEILRPTEDAYVDRADPIANFGGGGVLRVSADRFTSYLKFDASGANKNAQSVALRLFVESGNGDSQVFRAFNSFSNQNGPWRESQLSFINAPGVAGAALDSIAAAQVGQWIEFDVSGTWTGQDTLSLGVTSAAAGTIQYSAKEGARAPELVITSLPPPNLLPTITAFSPTSGTAGDEITINGARLNEVTSVTFSGFPATRFIRDSFTQLRVRTPYFAASGPITLANYAGEVTSANRFDFIAPVGDSLLTFQPSEDTYVDAADVTGNYGDGPELAAGGSAGSRANSYLKFALRGIDGEVLQARLELTVVEASDSAGTVYQTLNYEANGVTPWAESRLTWLNAPPAIGQRLFSAAGAEAGGTVTFDLTQSISGDGDYSFMITSASLDRVAFASGESGAPPVLTVVTDGAVTAVDGSREGNGKETPPDEPTLTANYPNPFNAGTRIEYRLPARTAVRITVFNLLGQRVRTLVDEVRSAGRQSTFWDGRDAGGRPLASGIYLVRLRAGNKARFIKILLQK